MGAVHRAFAPLIVIAVLAAGCGSSDGGETPTACLAPAATYLEALEAVPDPVRLAGETPISGCLVDDQSAGDLADVGASLVRTATVLSAGAERDPDGPQTLRLGYLVGAVQEGVSETSGIHTDLVRRIEASARYPRTRGTSSFDVAYARGYAAGRSGG